MPAYPLAPPCDSPVMATIDTISATHSLALQRQSEEWANTLTHAIGLALSIAGGRLLCTTAAASGDATRYVACQIYVATLIAVYLFSTLSHWISQSPAKQVCRALDQAFIYLLIVGTYTPPAVTFLYGGLLSVLLGAMWTVAAIGFLSKTVLRHRVNSISTVSYLLLGWMPVLSAPAAWLLMPERALSLFAAGGICYTVGVYFFLNDHRVRYFHSIWHLLVIAGSTFHFAAVYYYTALVVAG